MLKIYLKYSFTLDYIAERSGWIALTTPDDAVKDADDILEEIRDWVRDIDGAAPKWSECRIIGGNVDFNDLPLKDVDIEDVLTLAEVHRETFDQDEWELYCLWLDDIIGLRRGDIPDIDVFRAAYIGEYGDMCDFAEETYSGDIPDDLRPYIDWQAMGRDMERDGTISSLCGRDGVAVFWNND